MNSAFVDFSGKVPDVLPEGEDVKSAAKKGNGRDKWHFFLLPVVEFSCGVEIKGCCEGNQKDGKVDPEIERHFARTYLTEIGYKLIKIRGSITFGLSINAKKFDL